MYTVMETDIIVAGGGHAGCEAALAAARLGKTVALLAINIDSLALMPCNPNIGGTSKGHLVREIDALGGEMGRNIDKTYIQSRMLNRGKGPAVHSLRAQADKSRYSAEMRRVVESHENISLIQEEIKEILIYNGRVSGVLTVSGGIYNSSAVILCAGTYLSSRCLWGEVINDTGPNGLKNSAYLSQCLKSLGINIFRFKTGTPARMDGKTIDYSKMEVQHGDNGYTPFSFENQYSESKGRANQIPCYLTYTNEATHKVIRENIHTSPMYSGIIEGIGARYCPSIEDKVVRFADKDRHQVFIEPEGENTGEVYVAGMSTSLPAYVQQLMYRTVPGLENCVITRHGYAIEYDCIDASQLRLSLEFKEIPGLFSAGQLNGSSGYEEAAAQGLVAGINAARLLDGKKPVVLDRSVAYIGVLIDDLVTKGVTEPYRMMTSRAEYRLLLRQDNADLRLTEIGYNVGLISRNRYESFLRKKENIELEVRRAESLVLSPTAELNRILRENNSPEVITGIRLSELIKRPELSYDVLAAADKSRPPLKKAEAEQVNIMIKYEGYIKRQFEQVAQFKKMEETLLPSVVDYSTIHGLRLEARQKLNRIRPANVGQASRIDGVSPADISVLLLYLTTI